VHANRLHLFPVFDSIERERRYRHGRYGKGKMKTRAAARDMPISCPPLAAMVDIEREVPGNRRENLACADPDRLAAVDIIHFPVWIGGAGSPPGPGCLSHLRLHRIDHPHDNAADQKRGPIT